MTNSVLKKFDGDLQEALNIKRSGLSLNDVVRGIDIEELKSINTDELLKEFINFLNGEGHDYVVLNDSFVNNCGFTFCYYDSGKKEYSYTSNFEKVKDQEDYEMFIAISSVNEIIESANSAIEERLNCHSMTKK